MPQHQDHQIHVASRSTITVDSKARITLTPSDLELLLLEYGQTGLLFSNPTPHQQTTLLSKTSSTSIVYHLKQSLHRTLHFFPTLVGRLATTKSDDGAATCFFLDCGHEDGGVLFIHSTAKGLTVSDVNESSNSGPGVVPSLFPIAGICNKDGTSQPLLAVQVTELVDGLFVGWTVNHLVADGTAFCHFLNSWAEISRGEAISKLPILTRDQVNLDLVGAKDIYIRDEHLTIAADSNESEVGKLTSRANKEMEGVGANLWNLLNSWADGNVFWHFLNSRAEISLGEAISKLPILIRDQVNLDLVGAKDIRDEHLTIAAADSNESAPKLSERVFSLTSEKVGKLKSRANEEMEGVGYGRISSLQAVIALLWRSIIRSRLGSTFSIDEQTTFEIPMGARPRMSPPLPDEYFGNAVFPGVVTLEAGKVLERGLGWTAWQVNRMVASANGAEKVKEFYSSWAKEPKFLQFDAIPTNHFILINSPRFDVYGNDFGWGPPVAARSGKGSSFDGRVTVSAGLEEGSLDVEVCLLKETLSAMVEDDEFMEFVTTKVIS